MHFITLLTNCSAPTLCTHWYTAGHIVCLHVCIGPGYVSADYQLHACVTIIMFDRISFFIVLFGDQKYSPVIVAQ